MSSRQDPANLFSGSKEEVHPAPWADLGAMSWKPLGAVLHDAHAPVRTPEEQAAYLRQQQQAAARRDEAQRSKEAFDQAYQEGSAKARAEYADKITQYSHGINELVRLRQEILRKSETDVVQLALQIAREVLQAAVKDRTDFTLRMVNESLRLLSEADEITVRISPGDMRAVQKAHPELATVEHVKVVADNDISLGGVVADCSFGRVDATLDARLASMRTKLLEGK